MQLTPTQIRILRRAAGREGGNVCPTPGIHAGAQELVLRSLERRGLIKYPLKHHGGYMHDGAPLISGCGKLFAANAALGA